MLAPEEPEEPEEDDPEEDDPEGFDDTEVTAIGIFSETLEDCSACTVIS